MSTTIDNKVVEMSFNNSDFEKNAQKSIDTTEKLKKSLDFSGAGKGLDELGSAAKNVNIGVIGTACETVGQQFSAMKSIAVFALYDIYNMATRTANQLVQMFAIQPVSDGFAEYELKMGSVQTIMASTGASLQEVNGYLDELNLYADKTIYSFSDMTNNIGKFTNAGVSLDMAVKAIQGISNEAAVSGANTNEASRAMYNFAQALSAGYVKLIDWKSIENANMATKEFKQELIDTATELGTLQKQADGTYKVLSKSSQGSSMEDTITYAKNFNDSLQYQWMTTDVLTKTLAKYSDETTEIGKKAFAAATEVKTFSMMMDTLKEAVGSGWTETWETLIGDFNQSKAFWTELTDYFSDIISKTAKSRNDLLKGALDNDWESITGKIEGAGVKIEDFENKVKSVATERGIAIDDIIEQAGSLGEAFAKGELPVDLVTDAITKLGDETDLGSSKAKTLNDNLGLMLDNIQEKSGRTLIQESIFNVLDSIKALIEGIGNAWRSVDEGFTSSKLYDALTKINQATKDFKQYIFDNLADPWDNVEQAITDTGMTVDEFQNRLIEVGNQNGVDVQALIDQYGSLQEAFSEGTISGELVSKMFDSISSSADSATGSTENVTKTIENISDVLGDYQKVVDAVWNGDWKNASDRYQLLADAGYDYQKVQALVNRTVDQHRLTLEDLNAVGIETTETTQEQNEALLELANSAKESGTSINDALNKLGKKTGLQLAVESVHNIFISLKTIVESFGNVFTKVFDSSVFNHFADSAYSAVSFINEQTGRLAEYITSNVDKLNRTFEGPLEVVKSVGKDIIAVAEGIFRVVGKIFDQFSESAPDVLDATANIGDFFSGLADGLDVADEIEKFFDWLIDEIDKIKIGESNIGELISGFGTTIADAIHNIVQFMKNDGIKGIIDVFSNGGAILKDGLSTAFGDITDLLDGFLTGVSDFVSKLIPIIAMIAPIAGAVWVMKKLFNGIKNVVDGICNFINPFAKLNKVWEALGGFIDGLKANADKLTKSLQIDIISKALVSIAIAIGLIAISVAAFYGMVKEDPQSFIGALAGIAVCMLGLIALVGVMSKIKPDSASSIAACALIIIAMGVSIKLIASALSEIASIDSARLEDSVSTMIYIAMVIGILTIAVVRLAEYSKDMDVSEKKISTISNIMLKIGVSFAIMAAAIKIIGSMDEDACNRAIKVISVITIIMIAIMGAVTILSKIGDAQISNSLLKSIIKLGMIMTLLGGFVAIVSILPFDISRAVAITISMCAMINAIASAMVILSLMPRDNISDSVITAIGKMAIIMGALGAIVTICATLGASGNIAMATTIALSMCAMINALASAMLILSLMQNTQIDASVIVTIGILGAIMGALGLLVTYLSTLGGNVESAIATAASMSLMIIALSTAAVILGNYRGSIQSGMSAIVVLTALVTAIIAVATVLGGLSQLLGNGFMETLSAGMDVLVMITGKIGEAIGSFIGGLGNGLADQFVSMITKFASGVIMFNMAMATVDPNATQSAKNLADALGALAMVDFTNGLIFGQSDPSSFIKSAIQLGMGLQAFQIAIMGVNVETVSQGAQAVKTLVEGLSTIPTSGGLINGILGTADYSKFASGAEEIGKILPAFVKSTKGISGDTVAPAAAAIKSLIDTLNGVEPSGGLLQSVLGNTDYAGFADAISDLGDALPAFVESAGGVTPDSIAGPTSALANIIQTLHDMPDMNGILAGITGGKMDVNALKTALPLLGYAVKAYADNVADGDFSAAETATESIAKVIDQLRRLSSGSGISIESVNTLKDSINALASIDLSKLNSTFSSDNTSNLSNIGTALGDSIKGGLETAKSSIHESVNNLILDIQFTMQNNVAGLQQTGTQMVTAIATGMQSDTSGIPTVVNTIITEINNGFINSASMFQAAGANIASFFKMGLESSGGIGDSMTTALSTLYVNISNQSVLFYSAGANICAQFGQGILAGSGIAIGYVNAMMYQVSSAASGLSGLMQSAGTQAMAQFCAGIAVGGALAAAVAKSQAVSAASAVRSASVLFYSAGANCMIQAVSGIRAGGAGVPSAATATMSSACSAIRGYYGSFYSAGSYCTQGLANGISDGRYRVVSAAQVVAGAAVQAAMHKLDEHSPSRVFMQIGDYAAQGLAIGMTSDRILVENAASKMAGYSIDAASSAADAFSDLGTSIIPTIDYASLSKNTGRLDFSATMNRLVSNPMKSSAELMAETQARFDASNQRVVDSLMAVQDDLARYTNAVENTENAIYVDGKKLASSIAKPMNKELGIMSKRSRL